MASCDECDRLMARKDAVTEAIRATELEGGALSKETLDDMNAYAAGRIDVNELVARARERVLAGREFVERSASLEENLGDLNGVERRAFSKVVA